ncbi:hypothetical protein GCM10010176_072520 [Nonomuraea spiralis]|nr:hypothetical protein GCM10010176_072520 [Nonomuraea spiralis]
MHPGFCGAKRECADGVAPRRATSHLARRAGTPAILACVLADGGIGEVIRLRPWPDHGCLLCRRQALADEGTLDPGPVLEAGYGMGTLLLTIDDLAGGLIDPARLPRRGALALSGRRWAMSGVPAGRQLSRTACPEGRSWLSFHTPLLEPCRTTRSALCRHLGHPDPGALEENDDA